MSPSRILYLDNSFTFGGAIISLAHLVAGLDRRRFEPLVVSGQDPAYLDRLFPGVRTRSVQLNLPWVDDGFKRAVEALPGVGGTFGRRWAGRARGWYWLFRHELPSARRYAELVRRSAPALVHLNNNVESQLPEMLGAALARVPRVAHSRSFQTPGPAFRLNCRLVDHHIAISTAIRDNLIEAGVPADRVSIVHDGIDVATVRKEAAALPAGMPPGLTQGEFRFGLFGRVVAWKGTLEFVRAAAEVIRSVPGPGARAFIVGDPSDGGRDYFDAVRAAARESGVGDRIVLAGFREDVAAWMRSMDVVVHASVKPEPFGMVLIEAMAVERPVVATRGGGPDDIVAEGETGLLIPPGDHREMARAILSLAGDPQRRAAMGRRGAKRAEEQFSSDRYARKVMAVYDTVLVKSGEAR